MQTKGIAHNSGAFAYAYIVPILCLYFEFFSCVYITKGQIKGRIGYV